MKSLITSLLLGALALPSWAQSKTEQDVKAAINQFFEAGMHKNRAVAEKLLSPSIQLVNGKGQIRANQDPLAFLAPPEYTIKSYAFDKLNIQPYGDNMAVAVLEFQIQEELKGKTYDGRFASTMTWVKQPTHDWQIAAWQWAHVTPAPTPFDTKAIEAVANDYYRAFNQVDTTACLSYTTRDWYFLGTAPGERYLRTSFGKALTSVFRRIPKGEGFVVTSRTIKPLAGGQSAYIIEEGTFPIFKSPMRILSTYDKTDDGWKMRMMSSQLIISDDYLPQYNRMVSQPPVKTARN